MYRVTEDTARAQMQQLLRISFISTDVFNLKMITYLGQIRIYFLVA